MMIQGKTYWNRTVGKPHPNKFSKSDQWSFDLSIDEETQAKVLAKGVRKSYLRDKGDERGVFLSFTRDATRKDGSPGKPFEIVDAQGHPWPDNKLIGNGSVLNCIISFNEREYNNVKFLKPSCVKFQVWDHVPFEKSGSGFPTRDQTEASADTLTSDKEW